MATSTVLRTLRLASMRPSFYGRPAQLFAGNLEATLPSRRFLFRNNTSSKQEQEDATTSQQAGNQNAAGSQGSADQAAADDVNPMAELKKNFEQEKDKLIEQIQIIDDKYKRSLAEMENMRLRFQKQIEEAKIYGIQSFCKDMLDVADVLQMAVSSVPETALKDTSSSQHEVLKQLFEGVVVTEKQLQTVFRRHGLTQINPMGEKFNPNEHEALFEAPDPQKEPGSVCTVTKIGYKLRDRTIRPAMVGVVKASPPS